MIVSDAIEEFLSGYFSTHQRSPKTVEAYSLDLRQFAEFLPRRGMRIGQITPDLLENWAAVLKERQYAPASIRRKFASLRVFLAYWVRRGLLDRSPLWQIRLDLQRERTITPVLSRREVELLLSQAHQSLGSDSVRARTLSFRKIRNVAVVELLFATGIRVGELVSLRVTDYRREAGEMLIRGKGMRQRLALLTDRSARTILEAYADVRASLVSSQTSFFLNDRGEALTTQGVALILRRFAADAGLQRHITPHMMRHTVATLLLRNGADLRVVQEFLGHSSITTTERYTHVSKNHLANALRNHHPGMDLVRVPLADN